MLINDMSHSEIVDGVRTRLFSKGNLYFSAEKDGGYVWGSTLQSVNGVDSQMDESELIRAVMKVSETVYNKPSEYNVSVNISGKTFARISRYFDFTPESVLTPEEALQQRHLIDKLSDNYRGLFFCSGVYYSKPNVLSVNVVRDSFSKSFKELKRFLKDPETNIETSTLRIEFLREDGLLYSWKDLASPKVKNPKPIVQDGSRVVVESVSKMEKILNETNETPPKSDKRSSVAFFIDDFGGSISAPYSDHLSILESLIDPTVKVYELKDNLTPKIKKEFIEETSEIEYDRITSYFKFTGYIIDKMIALFNPLSDFKKIDFGKIEDMLEDAGLSNDLDDYLFSFIDNPKKLLTVDDIEVMLGDHRLPNGMTKDEYKKEIAELMKKQHSDPKAKERLRVLLGGGSNKTGQKNLWNMNESNKFDSIISQLLTENPDDCDGESWYDDPDNVTIFVNKDGSYAVGKDITHFDLLKEVLGVSSDLYAKGSDNYQALPASHEIHIYLTDESRKRLERDFDYIVNITPDASEEEIELISDQFDRENEDDIRECFDLSGRLFVGSGIISLWGVKNDYNRQIIDVLRQVMQSKYDADITEMSFEFLDNYKFELIDYDDYYYNTTKAPQISSEERSKLMKLKHEMPAMAGYVNATLKKYSESTMSRKALLEDHYKQLMLR